MPENRAYPPEGLTPVGSYTLAELRSAAESHTVLEGTVQRCDADLNLYLQLGSVSARIPKEEVTAPWISGADRDIAVLSRVGKAVCFTVDAVTADAKGAPHAVLSRRKAQEAAMEEMLRELKSGSVVAGRVVRTEPFGAFVDIGRGIVALLPTEYISAARIRHPNQRFRVGQAIFAVVQELDPKLGRVYLTHRELLGTWAENAARFQAGMTVPGIVRGLKEYGAFVELTPNLSGLAERKSGLREGDRVSVYIKAILPERMKIKLLAIDTLPPLNVPAPLEYFLTQGQIEKWKYAPEGCVKVGAETIFA